MTQLLRLKCQGHSSMTWDLPLYTVPTLYLLNPITNVIKRQPNIHLSETMCRTYDLTTQTQGQGHTSSIWYFIKLQRNVSLSKMFCWTQRLKVKVKLHGHGIYPWIAFSVHISSKLCKFFIKLHSNVSLSETMCRIYDPGLMTTLKVMVILKWLTNLIGFVITTISARLDHCSKLIYT